jgi:hypothetical protein
MKQILVFVSLLIFTSSHAQKVALDTLVDIGGYNMYFKIIEGKGTPILFESGAGDDGSVWDSILKHVHDVTGTTVISYDRSGFGQSELNPYHKSDDQFGILNGIIELETGLKKLGYFGEIILVSHSYGGFYTTLFSVRNHEKVKYNVRVDANLAGQYTEEILVKAEQDNSVQELKSKHLGMYYLGINFANSVRLMWKTKYPKTVPAIDIVSPIQRHHTDDEWQLLIKTHEDFVKEKPNRIGIIAYGSGHYIFKDNPGLVLNAIVKAYTSTLDDDNKRLEILSKSVDKSIELFIQEQKKEKE